MESCTVVPAVTARTARILKVISTDWEALPAFSTLVINDDVPMGDKDEFTYEDASTRPSEMEEGETVVKSYSSCHWYQHPSAISWYLCKIDDKRDLPNITVDGAPFDVDAHTTPSGFGDLASCTTCHDTSVRLCRELNAREGVSVDFGEPNNNPLAAFLPAIQDVLFPGTPIALRLKKINVYPIGGHFARHVDTPREGVLGTVVLHARRDTYANRPGALVLGTGKNILKLGGFMYSITAFYSDVPHEVVAGDEERTTIVYDIVAASCGAAGPPSRQKMRSAFQWLKTVDPKDMDNFAVRRLVTVPTVQDALQHVRTLLGPKPPLHLAVAVSHKYSYDEIAAGVPKGCDVQILSSLREWGYGDATLVPVLVRREVRTPGGDDNDRPVTQKECVVRATREDIQAYLADGVPAALPHRYVVVIPRGAVAVMHETYNRSECSVDFTGNESRDGFEDSRYWTCVFAASRQTGLDG